MGHYGEKPVGLGFGWRFGMEKRGDFRFTPTFRQHTLPLVGCATTHKLFCSDVAVKKEAEVLVEEGI